jgi:hypothetical protein
MSTPQSSPSAEQPSSPSASACQDRNRRLSTLWRDESGIGQDATLQVGRRQDKAGAPYFIKIVQGDNRVSHVALVRTAEDLRTIMPFLREAFDLAVSDES